MQLMGIMKLLIDPENMLATALVNTCSRLTILHYSLLMSQNLARLLIT